MSEKKSYYRVSPQLSDGEHFTIIENTDNLLAAIRTFCDEFFEYGYGAFKVQIVRMTEEELKAIPEI